MCRIFLLGSHKCQKNRWESQNRQKRVQENFDNDKYVCEGENPYGRVKPHFYMLGIFMAFFHFWGGMFFHGVNFCQFFNVL